MNNRVHQTTHARSGGGRRRSLGDALLRHAAEDGWDQRPPAKHPRHRRRLALDLALDLPRVRFLAGNFPLLAAPHHP